jgi:tRNA (cmo5U34)-methyltransferase
MRENFATTASSYFGNMVAEYDSLIRRAVPRYAEMSERLIDYLPNEPNTILELGCGTGNLSLRLAEKFPNAELTLVDASNEMIEITKARLSEKFPQQTRRANFVLACFEDLNAKEKHFDLVTSCISLHHVEDKQPIYEKVFNALDSKGTFRFADQIHGGTKWNHEKNWQRWLDFCREPNNCNKDEIQSLLDHAAAHDYYTPLAEHFRMLTDVGFKSVDCVWRNWIWGIITADVSSE